MNRKIASTRRMVIRVAASTSSKIARLRNETARELLDLDERIRERAAADDKKRADFRREMMRYTDRGYNDVMLNVIALIIIVIAAHVAYFH
jgi:hypothetical protein